MSAAAVSGVSGGASHALSESSLEAVTAWLRLVAEPMRVRIMYLLDAHGSATVQELCDWLPATTHQNVSKHLGVLYSAGLVSRVRQGSAVHYELADWTALWLMDQLAGQITAED